MSIRERTLPIRFLLALGVALAAACSGERSPSQPVATLGPYTFEGTGELPRVRFGDAGLSINERCPVRKNKLSLRMRPVWVNGRPVGFC